MTALPSRPYQGTLFEIFYLRRSTLRNLALSEPAATTVRIQHGTAQRLGGPDRAAFAMSPKLLQYRVGAALLLYSIVPGHVARKTPLPFPDLKTTFVVTALIVSHRLSLGLTGLLT